jgi:CrcB protein
VSELGAWDSSEGEALAAEADERSATSSPPRFAPRDFGLVFLGGGLGSLARWLVAVLLDHTIAAASVQLACLFIVNLVGAAFLGFINGQRRFSGEDAKSFWGAGFCGGFTTMSGLAIAIDSAVITPWLTVAMIFLGLVVYAGGLLLGQRGSEASSLEGAQ